MEKSKQTQGIHSNIKMPHHGTNISENNLQCSKKKKKSTFDRQGKELGFSLGSCGKAEEISDKPSTVNYSEFKLSADSELFPKHLKQ